MRSYESSGQCVDDEVEGREDVGWFLFRGCGDDMALSEQVCNVVEPADVIFFDKETFDRLLHQELLASFRSNRPLASSAVCGALRKLRPWQ